MDLEWSCFLNTSLVCRPFDHQTGLHMFKNISLKIYLLWPFYTFYSYVFSIMSECIFDLFSFIEQYFLFSNPFKFCSATYNNGDNLFKKQQKVQQAPPTKKNIHNFLVFVQFLWLTRLVSIFHYVSHKDFITLNSVDLKNCPNFFSGTNFNLTFSNCWGMDT